MSALEISLSALFDVHVEYINRRKYLTETKNGFRKENLITMLDDSRWKNFRYPFEPKREGVELGLNDNSFKLLKQIRILGGYKSYTDTLFVAMRMMYILSVQNGRGVPVNVFYKLYKPQRSYYTESDGYVYEDITEQIKEIKGIASFH